MLQVLSRGLSDDRDLVKAVVDEIRQHPGQWHSGPATRSFPQNYASVVLIGEQGRLLTVHLAESWAQALWEREGKEHTAFVALEKASSGQLLEALQPVGRVVEKRQY
jgi:hypothetical protein